MALTKIQCAFSVKYAHQYDKKESSDSFELIYMGLLHNAITDLIIEILYATSVILLAFVGLNTVITCVIFIFSRKKALARPHPLNTKKMAKGYGSITYL